MKAKTRNHHHSTLEVAMAASPDGRAPHGFGRRPDRIPSVKGAIFKRVELQGEMVYLPANEAALEEFRAMTIPERAKFMFSAPPSDVPVPRVCESKRIIQGARFKALPRGKREGDVFRGDEVRPIYPDTTGSLEALNERLANVPRRSIRKIEKVDIVGNVMKTYNLSYGDALHLLEELKRGAKGQT